MEKTIITVVGKDTVGIIAKVCTYLADNGINILDISQTIVQDYFNMMMIVDTNHSNSDKDFMQQIRIAKDVIYSRVNNREIELGEQLEDDIWELLKAIDGEEAEE